MAILNPSSAVIAKAKSKYGKRLTDKDYNALIKCADVAEVVQYLKSYTYYGGFLDKITQDIHRGQVEGILKERLFEDFLSLCRYNAADSPVTGYLLRRTENAELMKFITLFSIGKPDEYIFTLPLYFIEHTELPLSKMSGIRDYRSLLDALPEKSAARRVLSEHAPNQSGSFALADIEDALENASLKELYDDIGKIKNKNNRVSLSKLFDILSDYNNYTRIVRLKRRGGMSAAEIRAHLLPYGTLTGKRLNAILAHDDIVGVREALAQTKVGKKAQKIDIEDEMAVQGKFEMCRHELYFSTNPDIVLLAYYIVYETELKNVITVIEGVRYSMDANDIKKLLIR